MVKGSVMKYRLTISNYINFASHEIISSYKFSVSNNYAPKSRYNTIDNNKLQENTTALKFNYFFFYNSCHFIRNMKNIIKGLCVQNYDTNIYIIHMLSDVKST